MGEACNEYLRWLQRKSEFCNYRSAYISFASSLYHYIHTVLLWILSLVN